MRAQREAREEGAPLVSGRVAAGHVEMGRGEAAQFIVNFGVGGGGAGLTIASVNEVKMAA